MRITVRTTGLLGEHLPPGGAPNRAELEVPEGATPLTVMERLGLPDGRYLVALNGELVPPAERGARRLREGDRLSLMPPLKGG